MTRPLACLLGLGALLVGCERRAPGPAECDRFAHQALGIGADSPPLPPQVQAAVGELTRRCLTTPFDRELMTCVDQGRGPRRCLGEFQRRAGRLDRASGAE